MADFRINVIVDPSRAVAGSRQVERQLRGVEHRANSLARTLRNVFFFVGIASSIREIGRLADAFTNAQNRIRLVTKDTAQLNAVTAELFEIAKQTRVGFVETAQIYSRTALATKNLGLTQRETLAFTKSLNQAVILSGASAQEANAGLIQLSQGLASGTLRGDELRSVLEQLPKVADVIAQQMGITRGELRLLGAEGKISAQTVIDAFASAADSLERDFGNTVPTIGQAFTVLRTGVIEFIAVIDKATGFSSTLAQSIIFLSENLETLAKIAVIAGSALLTGFAKRGVLAATRAVIGLTLAIAANPIGALVVGVVAVVTALVQFSDQIKISADGAATLDDFFGVAFDNISAAATSAFETIKDRGESLAEFFEDTDFFDPIADAVTMLFKDVEFSIGGVLIAAARVTDGLNSVFDGSFNIIVEIFKSLPGALGNLFIDAANIATKAIESLVNSTIEAINTVNEFIGRDPLGLVDFGRIETEFESKFSNFGKIAAEAFASGETKVFESFISQFLSDVEARAKARINAVKKGVEDAGLDVRPERDTTLPFALREQLRLLEEEAKTLQLSNRERDIQNRLLKTEEKLRSSMVLLTDSQRELLEGRIRNNQALREQAEVLDNIQGPQEELMIRQEALNALYVRGAIDLATFKDQMLQLTIAQSELNISQGEGSFFDGFLVGIEQMLESVRNFSAEAGMVFADFFTRTTEGFADAISQAVRFGDSIKDAIGTSALNALSDLLSGLIKLGIQYVLNATLGETLATTATVAGVAQAAAISAAFATPAALVSLASFGANAAPAQAGIASTVALTQGLALALADGGMVRGAGGPRSDSIPAMLSDGEFVVNAKSTARFRPQLEAMNSGAGFQNGGQVSAVPSASAGGAGQAGGDTGGGGTRIINILDPGLMEDFIATPRGERVIVNVIERNSSSINQLLRNT